MLARRVSIRQLHTVQRLCQAQKQKDPLEVELGERPESNGGRVNPDETSTANYLLMQLENPRRTSLLPLERDLGLKKEKKGSKDVAGGNWDILEGIKLIGQLARGKKTLKWVKKPQAQAEQEDPVNQVLSMESWDNITQELETMVTRLRSLKSGEQMTVIGGGISGLSLAYFMAHVRPDVKINLLEKEDRVGGYMESEPQSVEGSSTVFEFGPRTLLPSHPGTLIAVQLMDKLGLADKIGGIHNRAAVNTKGMFYNDQLIQMPNNGGEAIQWFKSDFFKGMRFAMLKELFTKARSPTVRDESVEQFISRRFNKQVSDRLMSSMMRGIYAGDISELSARSVTRMNKLYAAERSQGTSIIGAMTTGVYSSLDKYANKALPLMSQALLNRVCSTDYDAKLKDYSMIALHGGIQQLATELARALTQMQNVAVRKNTAVKSIKLVTNGCEIVPVNGETLQSSIVVSTLGANQIGPCLTAAPEAQLLCSEVKLTNMAVVDFFFPRKQVGKNWFGFLVPKSQTTNEEVLGVIFDSAVRNSAFPILHQDAAVEEKEKTDFSSLLRDQLTDEKKPTREPKSMPQDTTITVMMGGHLWDCKRVPSQAQVVANAAKFLEDSLGEKLPKYHVKVKFQQDSIPQYTVGHSDRVHQIHDAVSKAYDNRLFLAGTSFGRGVGVGDCLVDSVTIATLLSPQRKLLFPKFFVNHVMAATHPSLYA